MEESWNEHIETYNPGEPIHDIKEPAVLRVLLHSDVTVTSWRLKSPATRLRIEHLIQITNKENAELLALCEGNPQSTCNEIAAVVQTLIQQRFLQWIYLRLGEISVKCHFIGSY